jgi:hypothetical protein
MSLRFSTGVVNNIATGMGWGDILKNSTIKVYSGTQPTTANDAASGTLLCQYTSGGSTLTAETRAACKMVLAGGSGSVSSIKVGGVELLGSTVNYNASVAQTTTDLITMINSTLTYPDFYAVVGGTVIGSVTYGAANAGEFYIIAPKNAGAAFNDVVVTTTSSTLTIALNGDASPSTSESGAFAAVSGDSVSGFTAGVAASNGLLMSYPPVLGVISKSGTWSDTSADNTGTAAWFRILCTPNYDDGSTNLATTGASAYMMMRIDGTVGTSGSDMIISNTSITQGAAQTVNTFTLTVA